jgi:hypothetical protein
LQRSTGPKSCWFPFKQKINNRRRLQDGHHSDWHDSISSSRSSKQTVYRSPRRSGRADSVSTGTDLSAYAGYSEQDSRTTTSSSSRMRSSASASYLSHCTNSVSNVSQANNSESQESHFTEHATNLDQAIDVIERSFLNAPQSPGHVGSQLFLDEDDSSVLVDPIETASNSLLEESEEPSVALALVETNCLSKEFWTDEMVDGGAFACFQHISMAQRCLPTKGGEEAEVLHDFQRTVTLNSIVDEKESGEYSDDQYAVSRRAICSSVRRVASSIPRNTSDKHERKKPDEGSFLWATTGTSKSISMSTSPNILYVSHEPENIKENQPLRRVLCNNIRLRRQQNRSPSPQRQGKSTRQSLSQRPRRSEPSELSPPSLKESLQESANSGELVLSPPPEPDRIRDALVSLPLTMALPATSSWRETEILSTACPADPCVRSRKPLSLRDVTREEEPTNFYVEVEAMSSQLNAVRDLG